MKKVLVLHGPNLNLLGKREPHLYGTKTLDSLNRSLLDLAEQHAIILHTAQYQEEGLFVSAIHRAFEEHYDYMIINAAAYTHTSIAIRDALLAVQIPFIEVHISNLYQRETYRQHSYLSDIAQGIIQGFGLQSYILALQAIILNKLNEN